MSPSIIIYLPDAHFHSFWRLGGEDIEDYSLYIFIRDLEDFYSYDKIPTTLFPSFIYYLQIHQLTSHEVFLDFFNVRSSLSVSEIKWIFYVQI